MARQKTALRITIYSVFSWIAVAVLYVALPSPATDDDGINYPTEVLRAGKTLTRVYSSSTYFPYCQSSHKAIERACMTMQSHFSLSFKIASGPSQNLSLLISNAKPIPLTPPAKLDQGDHGANTEDQREKILSRISDPFAVRSPAGETDGISLPWFSEADAALLHAYVSNGHMYVTLFTRWSDDRQLEIRAYGDDWAAPDPRKMKEPLLTLSLLPQLSAKVPEPPYSLSPTSTYPFRRILLSILSVSIFTPMVLYTFASHILSAILSALGFIFISLSWTALLVIVLLAARWTFQGRPDIGEFSADVGNDIRSAVGNLQRRWVIWRTPKDDDDRRSFLDHDYHGKQFDTES